MSYSGEICQECGLPVALGIGPTYWTTEDALWLRVVGDEAGVLCPRCFTVVARLHGIPIHWRAMEGV